MKKTFKKSLSILLAALMLLCLAPSAAAFKWGLTDEGRTSAIPLTLDVPAPVHIPVPERGEGSESRWFKFTPEEDGDYWFVCKSVALGVSAEWAIYDDKGERPSGGDWFSSSPDGLWVQGGRYFLEKGMTYYMGTSVLSWFDGGDYTVTVTRSAQDTTRRLVAPKKLTLNYHERVYLEEILKGSTIDFIPDVMGLDSDILFSNGIHDWYINYFYGTILGTGYLRITSGGETVEIEVTVQYTPLQWFCATFLGGWWWMKYTPLGDFSLLGTIRYLFPGDGFQAAAGRFIGALIHEFAPGFERNIINNHIDLKLFGIKVLLPFGFGDPMYWYPEIFPF